MNHLMQILLTVAFVASVAFSGEKKIDIEDFVWANNLKQKKVGKINLCGNADILMTKRSIGKDFLVGDPKKGYLFSSLVSYDEYWKILEAQGLEKAKAELNKHFKQTVLWQVGESGEVTKLGTPSTVSFAMTATVKDCMEGAKTTLGTDCSKWEDKSACCQEKFVGPKIFWKTDQGQFRLGYSPDPSIRLKVPNESKHRFCHSIEFITL